MKTRIQPLLLGALLLSGCGETAAQTEPLPAASASVPQTAEYAEGEELFTMTDTKEEAEQLAELYGIELVEWNSGVASFHTEEDPSAVIDRGKEKGWPLLEINYEAELF